MKQIKKLTLSIITLSIILTACTQSDVSTVEMNLENERYFYLDHDNEREEMYQTNLADISLLSEGKKAIARVPELPKVETRVVSELEKKPIWGYDFRFSDVSGININEIENYDDITFDSKTIWSDELPEDFNPEQTLEFNKNPGLNIREIHKRGITGKGVGIGIIDQTLLLDHEEYVDNLVHYEEIHNIGEEAEMHGPAVASIACGSTVGVAPDAKLYYIATVFGHFTENDFELDASIVADCIERFLEINETIPVEDKIRVISISRGFVSTDEGYEELISAIDKAKEKGVLVVTVNGSEQYEIRLNGLGRGYSDNPDRLSSFGPVRWSKSITYSDIDIMVPIGGRTFASALDKNRYEISNEGGMSWAPPWLAGMYALACEADESMAPEKFVELALETGDVVEIEKRGTVFKMGRIINPIKIIESLKK